MWFRDCGISDRIPTWPIRTGDLIESWGRDFITSIRDLVYNCAWWPSNQRCNDNPKTTTEFVHLAAVESRLGENRWLPHLPLANVVRGHDKPMGLSWVMPSPVLQDEIERTTGKSYAQSCIQGPTSGVSVRYPVGTSHSSFERWFSFYWRWDMLVSGRVSSQNQVKFFDGLMWWLRRVAKHSHRPCHATLPKCDCLKP